jgi:hypothetical protein
VHMSAKMGAMSEFLVIYLDATDERLLDYLDEDDELRPQVVKSLCYYASTVRNLAPADVEDGVRVRPSLW